MKLSRRMTKGLQCFNYRLTCCTRVRLKGKGIPTLRDSKLRGDHYVTLNIKVPEKMTSEQKDALRAYDALMRGDKPADTTDGGTTKKKRGLFK